MSELLEPWVDDDGEAFWAFVAEGELRMQACADCGRLRFPPRPMCPSCTSMEVEWKRMSGTGIVWSFVLAHPPLLPAYAELAPYNVVVVALDEDPAIRMVGNLVASADGPMNEILDVEIGAPVEVVFWKRSDGVVLPNWTPASS